MKGYVCFLFLYIVGCIGGDYVECIDCYNFRGVCQVHCFCEGHGDAEPCEASRPDGDVDLVDLVWLSAETVQNVTEGWKNLRTVPDGCGKSGFVEDFFADCYYHGAYSTGCFNS